MTPSDLPVPGTIAATFDLTARLRVFDADGSLAGAGRDAWKVIEPEVRSISEAYWQQWQRCFTDERIWAPHETQKMIDVGCTFLKDRFLDTGGRAWIESIERSVAAAYVGEVSPRVAEANQIGRGDPFALAGERERDHHLDTRSDPDARAPRVARGPPGSVVRPRAAPGR